MTERRFYVAPGDVAEGRLTLRGAEAHHARRVLRLGAGTRVVCFDGAGRAWRGPIAAYERDGAIVEIEETLSTEPAPRPHVTLAQGLVKGERMDFILQKATELGAARILPLRADRSDVRLDGERSARRVDRWHRIAVEAARQCERLWLPEIAAPATVAGALAAFDGPALAFVERGGAPAREALALLGASGAPERVTLFIGPEGGWTDAERAAFDGAGVAHLSLGPRILRAETAALAALAIVMFQLAED